MHESSPVTDAPNGPEIERLGDRALLLRLGSRIELPVNLGVHDLARAIGAAGWSGVVDVVPAYASLAVFADAAQSLPRIEVQLSALLREWQQHPSGSGFGPGDRPCHEIAVEYGGAAGIDLAELAQRAGLTPEAFIARHVASEYRVAMLGFQPGFPYLLGLDPLLAAPRRAEPRTRVAKGAVAIGGAQTGIYPQPSPGGWNVIGVTHVQLFDPLRDPPALLRAGDRVRLRPVEAAAAATTAEGPRSDPAACATHACAIEVVVAGASTSVQDQGRAGWRAIGVGSAGAADATLLRLANRIVGNPPGAAGLEITLAGPTLRFLRDAVIAWVGAEFDPRCGKQSVAAGRATLLRAGQSLRFSGCRSGARAWLAVAGGIDVAPVLGSCSTDLVAGFGGFCGRALRAGDLLELGAIPPSARAWLEAPRKHGAGDAASWWIAPDDRTPPSGVESLHVLPGSHWAMLDLRSREALESSVFTVAPDSNRMGVRLAGPPLSVGAPGELISEPVSVGTVQLPPSGQAIVLGVDAQTIGGYPRIAHVIDADHGRIAQLRPGARLRFVMLTPEQAAARNRVAQVREARWAEAIRMACALPAADPS